MSLPGFWEGDTQGAAGSPASVAGNAVMDKLGLSNPQMQLIQAGSQVLASMLGKSNYSQSTQTIAIDHSGWNIASGAGSSITAPTTRTESSPVNYVVWVGALMALALVVRAWKQ